jgi:hypothetical protein
VLRFQVLHATPRAAMRACTASPTPYICTKRALSKGPASTSIAAPRNIDEKGSLPYKPRQLSAMTRFGRCGPFGPKTVPFWAAQHRRTDLNNRQIARSAENDA